LGSRKNKVVIMGVEALGWQGVKSQRYRYIPAFCTGRPMGFIGIKNAQLFLNEPLDPVPPNRVPQRCPEGGCVSVDRRRSLFLNVDRQPFLCLLRVFMNMSILNPVTGWPGSSRHLHAAVMRCGPFGFFPDPPAAGIFLGDNLRPPPRISVSSIDNRPSP
jgi:hypothetical protein